MSKADRPTPEPSPRGDERQEIEQEKELTHDMEKRLAALNARLEILKRRKEKARGS